MNEVVVVNEKDEVIGTMSRAEGRERFLKSGSGRKYIKKQLANYLLQTVVS